MDLNSLSREELIEIINKQNQQQENTFSQTLSTITTCPDYSVVHDIKTAIDDIPDDLSELESDEIDNKKEISNIEDKLKEIKGDLESVKDNMLEPIRRQFENNLEILSSMIESGLNDFDFNDLSEWREFYKDNYTYENFFSELFTLVNENNIVSFYAYLKNDSYFQYKHNINAQFINFIIDNITCDYKTTKSFETFSLFFEQIKNDNDLSDELKTKLIKHAAFQFYLKKSHTYTSLSTEILKISGFQESDISWEFVIDKMKRRAGDVSSRNLLNDTQTDALVTGTLQPFKEADILTKWLKNENYQNIINERTLSSAAYYSFPHITNEEYQQYLELAKNNKFCFGNFIDMLRNQPHKENSFHILYEKLKLESAISYPEISVFHKNRI